MTGTKTQRYLLLEDLPKPRDTYHWLDDSVMQYRLGESAIQHHRRK